MSVFFSNEQDVPVDLDPLVILAELILTEQKLPEGTEVSLVLIDAEAMAEYNQRFMRREGATDVLAFPVEDLAPGEAPLRVPNGPPLVLGDVFICPEVVAGAAERAGVRFQDEMALMVVHGILHLLGFDHQEDTEAEQMEGRERELLSLVGVARP